MADLSNTEKGRFVIEGPDGSDLSINSDNTLSSVNLKEHYMREEKLFSNVTIHTFSGTALEAKLLIKNPSGSGVNVFLHHVLVYPVLAATTNQLNQISLAVYANPTITANGTLAASNNTHIGSTNTPQVLVYTNPTISAPGTLVGGGTAINEQICDGEFILKPNNNVLFYLSTNDASNSAAIIVQMLEETI